MTKLFSGTPCRLQYPVPLRLLLENTRFDFWLSLIERFKRKQFCEFGKNCRVFIKSTLRKFYKDFFLCCFLVSGVYPNLIKRKQLHFQLQSSSKWTQTPQLTFPLSTDASSKKDIKKWRRFFLLFLLWEYRIQLTFGRKASIGTCD